MGPTNLTDRARQQNLVKSGGKEERERESGGERGGGGGNGDAPDLVRVRSTAYRAAAVSSPFPLLYSCSFKVPFGSKSTYIAR